MASKEGAIWLKVGDDNTKFFHHFAKPRKNINSIWKITKEDDTLVENFPDIAVEGVRYFQNPFKEDNHGTIDAIISLSNFFPIFMELEDNQSLMAEVGKEELLRTLESFQKDKSHGPDGLPVELFFHYYDFI
jgi:hypothetical protein